MDDIALLLQKVRGTPIGNSLLEYLTSRGMMPSIKRAEPATPGASGEFSYTSYGDPGEIRVNNMGGLATIMHELTHAGDKAMTNQYYDELDLRNKQQTPRNDQFMDAYEKLWHGGGYYQSRQQNYGPEFLQRILGESWYNNNRDYRSKPSEAKAWGVDNMFSYDRGDGAGPPHLDPTMATEFDIMLDLARRRRK